MKLANKANPFPHGIPRTYAELVAVFAPRVIHDRIEFENASAVMNALAGHALNKEQEDYLETLAVLVDEYDRGHNTQPEKSSPLAVLHLLMEEHDLSDRDVGRILGNQAAGGFILRGEGPLQLSKPKIGYVFLFGVNRQRKADCQS
jgi:antitoxin component HigA of HigAB toxin-antitoxin module